MPAAKSERLLNLLIMLLVPRRPLSKAQIREHLYPDSSPDAFDRMFDRDKDELRALGVPIEVSQIDAYFDDEPGYRIRPDAFALPEVELDAEEAAVVGLATRVWQHATMASVTTEAVRKLQAAGADVDLDALDLAPPSLGADEPWFDVIWSATQERHEISFGYRRPGEEQAARRRLQPWGLVRFSGRWYVVGLDVDRGEERVFRLSRVEGEVRRRGTPGAYDIPEGVDLRATARRLAPTPQTLRATLLVRQGRGVALRPGALTVETDVAGPDHATGWDRLELERRRDDLVGEVLAHGADVVVGAPHELRDAVVARLRALAGEAAS